MEWFKVPSVSNYGNNLSLLHIKLPGVMSRRIRRISIIKLEDQMYEKLESSEEVKMRAERELEMTTDLLVGAGVKEPRILKIKSSLILKGYLLLCTVIMKILRTCF